MSKLDQALFEFQRVDSLSENKSFLREIHPLVKLVISILYVSLTASFHKYDLGGLLGMILYPLFMFQTANLSFPEAIRRVRIVLPLVCVIGIVNPFFDQTVMSHIGSIPVTGGVMSMITLVLKGILLVLAAYLLIATTSMEEICYALQKIHMPSTMVVSLLLTYRYISLLLREAGRLFQAYKLRAPGQKGVAFEAWGSLLGMLLIRSMDRAGVLYESMRLRGFHGELYPERKSDIDASHLPGKQKNHLIKDVLYLAIWGSVLIVLRLVPVMVVVGELAGRLL